MKNVVVACDSFKESMSAIEACLAVKEGVLKAKKNWNVSLVPMADGGEGTIEVISYVLNSEFINVNVHGPLGESVEAKYLLLKDQEKAFIEVAEACGLNMILPQNRNPLKTSTFGVGELILDAIDHGIKDIYIGLGGSSTNDGGLGLLRALKAKFYDINQNEIFDVEKLIDLEFIDLSKTNELLEDCHLTVLSDVDNVFIGQKGATYTFGKQKGANEKQLNILENCLTKYNAVVLKQFGLDLSLIKKTGAAGGLGGAFYLLGATMKSGIETILKLTNFEEQIKNVDYIITGEGSIDRQTENGKTISGIMKIAKQYNIPVIAFAGRVTHDIQNLYTMGLTSVFSITNEAKSLNEALSDGYVSLEDTVYNVFRLL